MKHLLTAAFATVLLSGPACAQEAPAAPSPNEIVSAAPSDSWVRIAPEDLLVMELAPDRDGKTRRVVIQLMPPPFSQGWIGNIRTLAAAHYWDGTSVNRVQDNYVVQWGDATEEKPLPEGLAKVPESGYVVSANAISEADAREITIDVEPGQNETTFDSALRALEGLRNESEESDKAAQALIDATRTEKAEEGLHERDSYAEWVEIYRGWPLAAEKHEDGWNYWPVHCYGMVGVGRGYSPDTGSGAELYTVIGHAPRHLDRNIALVGRVVEGIENLSSLPRGTGDLGFYETEAERIPIVSVRLASALPEATRPAFEYLDSDSEGFAKYAEARANRRDPFFIVPAGGADICNIPVPVRRVSAK